jgi:hydrogenase maturation factor
VEEKGGKSSQTAVNIRSVNEIPRDSLKMRRDFARVSIINARATVGLQKVNPNISSIINGQTFPASCVLQTLGCVPRDGQEPAASLGLNIYKLGALFEHGKL